MRGRTATGWHSRICECPGCSGFTIELAFDNSYVGDEPDPEHWQRVYPNRSARPPVPPEVPAPIAADFLEACEVLATSAKASAALSRRCLQAILHESGYQARDLAKEVDLVLNETDPRKAIPEELRMTLDAIRNFGNFSAHPITDVTTLQIIDVEPEEAEWCLEVVEECFRHFYVRPAQARARKAALDAKLAAAGKPPSR